MPERRSARAWLDTILEPGYELLFEDVVSDDPLQFPGYREDLEEARARTGCTESVLVARGSVGVPRASVEAGTAIVIAFEFGFLGGSMGVAAGERIRRAFELGADTRTPVVALTASGGVRMQEGMLGLGRMPATILARRRLADAGQPFIAYLRDPTTGGVYASFASTADVIWAEPGATVGFAGPRVAEAVTGEPLPPGSHTAELALSSNLVDELIAPEDLRDHLKTRFAGYMTPPRGSAPFPEPEDDGTPAWERVLRARASDRPSGGEYAGNSDPGATLTVRLASFGSHRAIAIAQHRHHGNGRTTPAGYRRARRAIRSAGRLGLPIVTFIDTPGADPSTHSDQQGVAFEISETFNALLEAPVPTVAVVVGEGGSGGALALAACDRLLIQENAIFSVIAPEGAAAILRRTDVQQVAADLRLTAFDLRRFGIADRIIPDEAKHTTHAIAAALEEIKAAPTERRLERWQR